MYYTEGYVDKQTYFIKGRIWSNAMMHQGNICYIWCVSDGKMEEEYLDQTKECIEIYNKVESALRKWIHQELSIALGNGQVAIQKEVNRFNAFWEKKVYVYYQGHLFTSDEGSGLWQVSIMGVGVFISSTFHRFYEVEWSKKCTVEQLANQLKTRMLLAVSEDKIEKGYFFVWEDTDAF